MSSLQRPVGGGALGSLLSSPLGQPCWLCCPTLILAAGCCFQPRLTVPSSEDPPFSSGWRTGKEAHPEVGCALRKGLRLVRLDEGCYTHPWKVSRGSEAHCETFVSWCWEKGTEKNPEINKINTNVFFKLQLSGSGQQVRSSFLLHSTFSVLCPPQDHSINLLRKTPQV